MVLETAINRRADLLVTFNVRHFTEAGQRLGLSRGRYHEWSKRAAESRLADLDPIGVAYCSILPEEKQAVLDHALEHPKDGYRRLAWQMIDADVAYMSRERFRILLVKSAARVLRGGRRITVVIQSSRAHLWQCFRTQLRLLPSARGSPHLSALPSQS